MGRPQNIHRKNEILRSSVKVFGRHASWDTSLNELARQLKTSTRMLVHHFETREKLVAACRREVRQSVQASFSQAVTKDANDWCTVLVERWAAHLQNSTVEERKLQILNSLQSSLKQELKENEHYIENLRELLPSRYRKFAEDIFTFERGLELQLISGTHPDRGKLQYRRFLKLLEK